MRDLILTQNITIDGVIDASEGRFAPSGAEEVDPDRHHRRAARGRRRGADGSGHVPPTRLANVGQPGKVLQVRVNVGQAKTDLSKLLARVEAGEDVEIARDGDPVARLVRVDVPTGPGERFLAARGSLAGRISMEQDFELTNEEIDDFLEGPI